MRPVVDTGAATADKRRALTGAVLLDLAVSPLFAWDVFTDSLGRDLGVSHALLAGVFSVGLAAFMLGVLVGGRAATRSRRAGSPSSRSPAPCSACWAAPSPRRWSSCS